MDKLTKIFFKQVQVIQKQLEDLLEKQPQIQQEMPELPLKKFEVLTDLTQIDDLSLGLPQDTENRVEILFSRLTPYFESGLLLNLSATKAWQACAGFDQGQYFPLKGAEFEIPFQFPKLSLVEIRKLISQDFLNHLKELQVIKNEKSDAYLFSPHPDYIFLVTSAMADPWFKIHIEKIQKHVLMSLVDQF